MPTNQEWRVVMEQARKEAGLTQRELATRVGTSQNIISLIESGGVASSHFVMPICRVLKIPPPVHFQDEDDAAWSQLGHLLRVKNMRQFKMAMALVESMLEGESEDHDANGHGRRPKPRR